MTDMFFEGQPKVARGFFNFLHLLTLYASRAPQLIVIFSGQNLILTDNQILMMMMMMKMMMKMKMKNYDDSLSHQLVHPDHTHLRNSSPWPRKTNHQTLKVSCHESKSCRL